jgi:hypothetical protein
MQKLNKIAVLSKANYDLFCDFRPPDNHIDTSPPSVGLPPLPLIYEMYQKINQRFFESRLPIVRISYSQKMLIAGSYTPALKEIRLGIRYHKIFPDDIEDTLKHEMIHILNPSHNGNFKAMAKKIGASLKAKSHPDLQQVAKYIYICPVCARKYPRRKRLRMVSCGVCSKNRKFDQSCKLILLQDKKICDIAK